MFNGHNVLFDNVKILSSNNRRNIRMFLEASFSKADHRNINRHLDIPAYYNNIILKYAR